MPSHRLELWTLRFSVACSWKGVFLSFYRVKSFVFLVEINDVGGTMFHNLLLLPNPTLTNFHFWHFWGSDFHF